MESIKSPKLYQLEPAFKILATAYILCILVGYFVSILKVYELSHFSMRQAATYYRGDETGDSMQVPQSFGGMLSVAHVHSMSQPFLFAILGFIFAFSNSSQKTKCILFVLAFGGILISNAAPWLVRYESAEMIYLFPFSQILIFISIAFMSLRSLYDAWIHQKP